MSSNGTGLPMSLAPFGLGGMPLPGSDAYVQSGLVLQLDGIDNAGVGVHSNNPTVWKDLVGTNDFTLVNAVVDSKYIAFPTDDCSISTTSSFIDSIKQVEMVVSVNNDSSDNYYYAIFLRRTSSNRKVLVHVQNYANRKFEIQGNQKGFNFTPEWGVAYSYSANFSTYDFFADGVQMPRTTVSAQWGTDSVNDICIGRIYGKYNSKKVYSLRLYNRALTAQEVAANYAIDKQRFGV